jgi:hypothetical protein
MKTQEIFYGLGYVLMFLFAVFAIVAAIINLL